MITTIMVMMNVIIIFTFVNPTNNQRGVCCGAFESTDVKQPNRLSFPNSPRAMLIRDSGTMTFERQEKAG